MSSTKDTAVICGNGINAHTLLRTLARLNWPGRRVLLWHASEGGGLAGALNPKVEKLVVNVAANDEIPALLESRFGDAGRIHVLFTDERYHPAFAAWQARHPATPLHCYLGAPALLPVILDRWEFVSFIAQRGLAAVPRTIGGEEDPEAILGSTFIVRPRLSWFGTIQRERVKLVEKPGDLAAALVDYASRGLQRSDLCFQERLSGCNRDNVSICGWFGSTHRHLFCTRKVLQYPPRIGGGDVVETLSAPPDLLEAATAILSALAFEGPFEMEFVRNPRTGIFNVTELNPRFWLQHGLIEAITGCALTAACLEMSPIAPQIPPPGYWVNPLYAFFRLLKLDFRGLCYYASRRSWKPLTIAETGLYAGRYLMQALKTQSVPRQG